MKRRSLILFFVFISIFSSAQTVTWDDGGSGYDGHDPLNWNGDILPNSSDEVIINSSDFVSIFNAIVYVRQIDNSGSFTINPSMTLTLDTPGEIALGF